MSYEDCIDVVQEWANDRFLQPPAYVSRGDPAAFDFAKPDLTLDDALHTLDLSGIIPANAKAVHIFMYIVCPGVGTCFWLYATPAVNYLNSLGVTAQIAGIEIDVDGLLAVTEAGLVEYSGVAVAYTTIQILVKGWIL